MLAGGGGQNLKKKKNSLNLQLNKTIYLTSRFKKSNCTWSQANDFTTITKSTMVCIHGTTAERAGNTGRSHDCQHTHMEFEAFIHSFKCSIGRFFFLPPPLHLVGPLRQAGRQTGGVRHGIIPLCGSKHAFRHSRNPLQIHSQLKGKHLLTVRYPTLGLFLRF